MLWSGGGWARISFFFSGSSEYSCACELSYTHAKKQLKSTASVPDYDVHNGGWPKADPAPSTRWMQLFQSTLRSKVVFSNILLFITPKALRSTPGMDLHR